MTSQLSEREGKEYQQENQRLEAEKRFLVLRLAQVNAEVEYLEGQVRERLHDALEIQTSIEAVEAELAGAFKYE